MDGQRLAFGFVSLSPSGCLREVLCQGLFWDAGTYLAAFTGDATIVVPCGFVPTHYTELILV